MVTSVVTVTSEWKVGVVGRWFAGGDGKKGRKGRVGGGTLANVLVCDVGGFQMLL